ncbi:hypothetical protein [Spongiimicrobium sp. 3-5]|uniref:hypothetical protein n=1 Tax=Spongiimicrobium sp. 3-5 TaxID=3332596 RepID=UPI003980E961
MEKNKVENRFKIGDVVCAKVRPSVSLVVRLYARKVYYCAIQNNPLANELVYFDRELKSCDGLPQIWKT